jgi:heme oxygenase
MVREQLRQETAALHRRLEAALGLLHEPPCGLRMRALLARFHGFHRVWEPALAACLGDGEFTRVRRRTGLLRLDLAALGLSQRQIDALAGCDVAASLCRTRAAALGSLYVMEGSTLGGRHIARHLATAPWLPAGGLHYFEPYGAHTGARWQETLSHLEAAGLPCRALADGARDTFELLHDWLTDQPAADSRHLATPVSATHCA